MKTYNKFILALLGSTLVVSTGTAQTWTVNGNPQSTPLTASANEAAVAIDPITGIASVRTPGAGPSLTISANPSALAVNASTTVSWNAAGFGGNLNCTRSSTPTLSGWTGSISTASGSVSVTMPSTAQTVTLTLNCTGDNGTAGNSTNVTVASAGQCGLRPPSLFGSPRNLINQTFSSVWNSSFPGPFNAAYGAGVPGINEGTVIAYSFVAPTGNAVEGYLLAVYSPDSGGRGSLAAGFSECPGEINNLTPTCSGSAGKIRSEWTSTGRAGACNLIPGRTYYYNLSVESCVSGPEPGTPGGICSFRLESKRYF